MYIHKNVPIIELPDEVLQNRGGISSDIATLELFKTEMAPFYPITIFAQMHGEDDKPLTHIEYVFATLNDRPEIQAKPPIRSTDKKYHFRDTTKYKTDKPYPVAAPQQIGVLTKKKIDAWLDYYAARKAYLMGLENENAKKIAEFVKKYSEAGGILKEQQHAPHLLNGRIERGGLEYTVRIDTDTGSISEKIELQHNYGNNLQKFVEMSTNHHADK